MQLELKYGTRVYALLKLINLSLNFNYNWFNNNELGFNIFRF